MIDIFDKLNAAYGDQTLADSDQIKDKKFGKKQDVLNKEILDPDDPNSLKSKVNSFNGIVIDPDPANVVSSDKSDIEVGSSKIPTGNAVAGALSDAVLKAGVFDISAYNLTNDQPTPYADLEAALGNNGENVPEAVRKGGMQVKFIQGSVGSSDNKYIQARCMAQNFTTDTTQWAIADEDVYVENPEFIYVKTDAKDKILWAIKTDGGIYYGAGVPQQVIDYIEKKIAELSLDEYGDIVAFLNDLEKGDKTLQNLLDEKVDKEEGKSLIDAEYASTKSIIENPKFLDVTLDAEDKVIEGIQIDGTKVIGGDLNVGGSANINGDTKILGNMEVSGVSYKVIENPEYLAAWVNAEDKVIFGFKYDGKTYAGDVDFLNEIKNNQEAISEIKTILGSISSIIESLDIDSKSLIDKEVAESLSAIEDPEERSEIKTDAEEKIISYRKADGTKVENVGIEVDKLTFKGTGLSDFAKNLKDSGFVSLAMSDFSSVKTVELPEPKHYSMMNLIIDALPVEDSDVSKGSVEYYDFYGNYFKKACKVERQGQTSIYFAKTNGKGNYTLKIDDKSKVKFGMWPPQKSFHLKGSAKDVTRGILATSYKFAEKVMRYLDANPARMLRHEEYITTTTATGDRMTDWVSDARCLPDGFPVEVYINGEYWGLCAIQLQKKSNNYAMEDDDYTSLIIDADTLMNLGTGKYVGGFWTGDIWWDKFEVRNPEPLICMDGSEYDGDHPQELIDNSSPHWNPSNADHVNTATAKAVIEGFPVKYQEVKDLIDADNLPAAKIKFADNFDVNSCMLVYIFNCFMKNSDSINKNTLWGVWNNGKIAPMLWDLDAMYGQGWTGTSAGAPSASLWEGAYAQSEWPLGLFWTLYEDEIKAAYANLRRDGVLTIDSWKEVVFGWVDRIGTEAFERDIKKWKETPSYRKNYTNTAYWTEGSVVGELGNIPLWDALTPFAQGERCAIKLHDLINAYMIYTAVQASTGVCPVTKFYTMFPIVGGFYDSPKRMQKWMESQIALCDTVMQYSE